MHIVVIPGTNYNNAPAGFSAAVDYVVNLFDNLYTANVTVYINVDYGQIDSTNATVPPLGKSNWNLNSFSYSTVRQALINMGAPGSNTLSVRRHVMADHGASEGVGAASCDVPTRQRLSLSRRGWLRGGRKQRDTASERWVQLELLSDCNAGCQPVLHRWQSRT